MQTQVSELPSAHDFCAHWESRTTEEGSGESPEVQVLIACARTVIQGATAARLKSLLSGQINWKYLLDKAHKHGVMPLLYRSLESTSPELVPDGILNAIRSSFQRNAFHNLFSTRELLLVLQMLESRGIPALPFKGPVLAAQAYGHLGLRQYGDLDILVRKRDVTKVKRLLHTRAYRLAIPLNWTKRLIRYIAPGKDVIFVKGNDKNRIIIELHWRLTDRYFDFPLDMKKLWQRLVPISLAGSTVRSLPLEDLILYLCLHGTRHSWERLAWICDVAELIRVHPEIDWDSLMNRARTLGNERALALGLFLASDLLGASLPEDVLARIQIDPKVRLVAARVRELLFQRQENNLDVSYWYRHHLLMKERFPDRMKLYLHYGWRYFRLIFTPNERDHEMSLPSSFSFLYYLIRPIRLMSEYSVVRSNGWLKKVFRGGRSREKASAMVTGGALPEEELTF